jgi:hypothetical protein
MRIFDVPTGMAGIPRGVAFENDRSATVAMFATRGFGSTRLH